MLGFTWLGSVFRWKTGRGEPRLPFYSFKSSFLVRKSKIRDSIRLRRCLFPSRSRPEEGDTADTWDPLVSDRKKGEATAPSAGPAHARGKEERQRLRPNFVAQSERRRRVGRAAQQVSNSFFFFYLFSKPFK
jgi:hypothetical protein